MRPLPKSRAQRLAPTLAALLLLPHLAAQQPPSPAQRLQQLLTAEQAALDAGDQAAILASGRQLASLALHLLADLQSARHRPDAAARSLEQALALNPDPADPSTRLALLTADLQANLPRDAALVTQQLLQTSGDTALLHIRLAGAHHTADDLSGTLAELSRAVELDPTLASAHLALGIAFWELNEYQYNPDSLREFTAAQRLAPADYSSNLNLGSILSQYQRYPEAQPLLAQAALLDPSAPEPWLQLGMNLYAEDRLPEARPSLEKAVSLTGTDLARNSFAIRRALAVLSLIEASAHHDAEARKLADEAEHVHAEMLHTTAVTPLSESTGLPASNAPTRPNTPPTEPAPATAAPAQQQQLEQQLLAIIASSLNDAGTALARTRDYAGALPLFREAALANPALSPVQRNLGLAAFHTGHFDEAIPAFTRALEQNPADTLSQTYLEQSRTLRSTTPQP